MALLALFLLLSASVAPHTSEAQTSRYVDPLIDQQEPIFVVLDGYQLSASGTPSVFDVPPVIVNETTFVEVNGLFTEMGISLTWYGDEQRVRGVAGNGTVIDLYLGSTTAYVNGVPKTLAAAPFVATEYSRTMVPLSFVASEIGATVRWINGQRTAYILQNPAPLQQQRDFKRAWHLASHTYRGYGTYGEAGPISVTQAVLKYDDGTPDAPVWLVSLSGTDTGRSQDGEAVGYWEDFLVGLLGAENDYLTDVINVIESYVTPGTSSYPTWIVLSGHSLGGMVAQQVATELNSDPRYDVLYTVAFGSPLIDPLQREGTVTRLGDKADPIPQASTESQVLWWWNQAGVNWEAADGYSWPSLSVHNFSYQMGEVWNAYDGLGLKNRNSYLRLRPRTSNFYPAPRLKAALHAAETGESRTVDTAPDAFSLDGVAPNPVRGRTLIRYALPSETHVRLDVYDVMGRRVATPVDGRQDAGAHVVPFDASDLAPGTYVYRVTSGSQSKTGRLTVVR